MKAWHVLIGLALVGGGAFAVVALTREDTTRHGIRFGGCADVEVVDLKAWGAFVTERAKAMITEGRRDAKVMIAEIYAEAVPECEWPPPEGSPLREKWDRMIPGASAVLKSWFPEAQEGAPAAQFEARETQPAEVPPPLQFKPTAANAAKIGGLMS